MPGVDADVIVVGAGINGVATADALARRGRRVVLLEQDRIGTVRGSSHGTSRIFRLAYPDARWVRLAQQALAGWRALEEDAQTELLVTTGSVDLGAWGLACADALERCGARVERLTGRDAEGRWPLRIGADEAFVHQPDAGALHAGRVLHAYAARGRAHGASVREGTRAVALEDAGDRVTVATGDGPLIARAVVVTAGGWARQLVAPLGIEVPVTVTRETVTHFAMPVEPVPCVLDDVPPASGGKVALRPGSLAYALWSPGIGVKVGLHQTGPVADADDEAEPDANLVDWAATWAASRFEDLDGAPARVETCLYTSTADEGFVLERHGRVVVGSACSGHAFKFAPVVGEQLADLAAQAL